MTLADIGTLIAANGPTIAVLLFIVLTVVQITPIKLNPWKTIARVIGRAMNSELTERVDGIKERQDCIKNRLEEHIQIDDERDADMRRQRILRFNHDIMRDLPFTKEFYDDILIEIDMYESYCESHPNYKNSRAKMAIVNIKRMYEKHETDNDFAI